MLRPGSVSGADLALRSFAAFLAEASPPASSLAEITRRHVEDFKPWLAARPGQNKPRLTPATIAHRLGTLRMFFVRIDEWGWDEAPPRVPMFPGDLPRQDHPLPKALDDATAARLLRAAQADRADAGPRHRRDAAAHRAAGQRVHRPAGRRRRAHRRRAVAARPGRQAPRGPLPAPAPPAGHPHRRLPGRPRPGRITRCCCPGRTAARWTGTPSPG